MRAATGTLRRIAPRRFNPGRRAWLPILHAQRGGRFYTALFSNTARAHELGRTRDWVVLYADGRGAERQWTIVTETSGEGRGERVVRGREEECRQMRAADLAASAASTVLRSPETAPRAGEPHLQFDAERAHPGGEGGGRAGRAAAPSRPGARGHPPGCARAPGRSRRRGNARANRSRPCISREHRRPRSRHGSVLGALGPAGRRNFLRPLPPVRDRFLRGVRTGLEGGARACPRESGAPPDRSRRGPSRAGSGSPLGLCGGGGRGPRRRAQAAESPRPKRAAGWRPRGVPAGEGLCARGDRQGGAIHEGCLDRRRHARPHGPLRSVARQRGRAGRGDGALSRPDGSKREARVIRAARPSPG